LEKYQLKKVPLDTKHPNHNLLYTTTSFLLLVLTILAVTILFGYCFVLSDPNNGFNLSIETSIQPLSKALNPTYQALDNGGFNISLKLYQYSGMCESDVISVAALGYNPAPLIVPTYELDLDAGTCTVNLSLPDNTVAAFSSSITFQFSDFIFYASHISYSIATANSATYQTSINLPFVNEPGAYGISGYITPSGNLGDNTNNILHGSATVEILSAIKTVNACQSYSTLNWTNFYSNKRASWNCESGIASTKTFAIQDVILDLLTMDNFYELDESEFTLTFMFRKAPFGTLTVVQTFVSTADVCVLALAMLYVFYSLHKAILYPACIILVKIGGKLPEKKEKKQPKFDESLKSLLLSE